MLLIVGRNRFQGVYPEQLLRDFAFDRSVVLPARFQPQSAHGCIAGAFEPHVTEGRGNRLRRRRSVDKLRQTDQHIDEEIARVAIVGICPRYKVEIGMKDCPLRPGDAEELGQTVEQRCFASGIRADDSYDLGGKAHSQCFG
ncbi:MAG: hypothetical protein WCC64_04800, partial [Aliidongia sp.]